MQPTQFSHLRPRVFVPLGSLVLFLALAISGFGQVQEKVLYSFCSAANCADGGGPHGKLTFDRAGNLYGTTVYGGSNCQENGGTGCGTVFELSPLNGAWTETILYSFGTSSTDGASPMAGPTFDKSGNLYGTTQLGGAHGLGSVFMLSPPVHPGDSWAETLLWSFGATGDGRTPLSHLIIDSAGNLYGTTAAGGTNGGGTVFQLVPSKGQWSENILFSFGQDDFDGYDPEAGVAFDKAGNLYGTTLQGGTHDNNGWGVIYKLSPNSQLPWTETVLFRFTQRTGANPRSAVSFDRFSNLYVTLSSWGLNGGGSAFRLTPEGQEHTDLFTGTPDGASPQAGLFILGNSAYGTTELGGSQGYGSLFRIRRKSKEILYNFCSLPGCADGRFPVAALVLRGKSFFGTTGAGGANGDGGTVFQISEASPSQAKSTPGKGVGASKIRPVAATSH